MVVGVHSCGVFALPCSVRLCYVMVCYDCMCCVFCVVMVCSVLLCVVRSKCGMLRYEVLCF